MQTETLCTYNNSINIAHNLQHGKYITLRLHHNYTDTAHILFTFWIYNTGEIFKKKLGFLQMTVFKKKCQFPDKGFSYVAKIV